MRGIVSFLVVAVVAGGCTTAYSPTPLPTNHPANPVAPETPPPPPSFVFQASKLDEKAENVRPARAKERPGPHSGHGAEQGGH
jgi:hypothetical protein